MNIHFSDFNITRRHLSEAIKDKCRQTCLTKYDCKSCRLFLVFNKNRKTKKMIYVIIVNL